MLHLIPYPEGVTRKSERIPERFFRIFFSFLVCYRSDRTIVAKFRIFLVFGETKIVPASNFNITSHHIHFHQQGMNRTDWHLKIANVHNSVSTSYRNSTENQAKWAPYPWDPIIPWRNDRSLARPKLLYKPTPFDCYQNVNFCMNLKIYTCSLNTSLKENQVLHYRAWVDDQPKMQSPQLDLQHPCL